jgi:hypothetical protein
METNSDSNATAEAKELPAEKARRRRYLVIRWALFLLPTLGTYLGTYLYLDWQAKPYTPPEGYVFPREPVLVGTYRYEAPGGKIYRTWLDQTPILCNGFSYYSATFAQTGAYTDCGRRDSLRERQVEVHRVRLPLKNPDASPMVVKIVSDGVTYLDISDAEVRNQWISDTDRSASSTARMLTLFAGGLFWWLSGFLLTKIGSRRVS